MNVSLRRSLTAIIDNEIETAKKIRPNTSDESDESDAASPLNDFEVVTNHFGMDDEKPEILVCGGNLHEVVDQAEKVLFEKGDYYQRAGMVVTVDTDPEFGGKRIRVLTKNALVKDLAVNINWKRPTKDGVNDIDPPARHVGVIFDSAVFKHLNILRSIVRQPYLRDDGSLMKNAGYDLATGVFGEFDESEYNVPEDPTREQCIEALAELNALLDEFPFQHPYDRSAALATILTASIRVSLPAAPLTHVSAPQIASGKSYLCSLFCAFTSNTKPSALAFPSSDEECQKHLLATFLEAPAAIVFDNLTSDLKPFKTLCSAITEEFIEGRILGQTKIARVGTRSLLLSSGNNVGPVSDMTRRSLTILLDPNMEMPASREFKNDPVQRVRANRAKYLTAALTIVRGGITNPEVSGIKPKPIASFDTWTQLVRKPLIWLGEPDPATRIFDQQLEDPDRELAGRLLAAWRSVFGPIPTMVREAVKRAEGIGKNESELKEVFHEIAGSGLDINRQKLGKALSRYEGRVVHGMKLQKVKSTGNAEKWKVFSFDEANALTTSSDSSDSSDDFGPIEMAIF
jgi:hypothetical protein